MHLSNWIINALPNWIDLKGDIYISQIPIGQKISQMLNLQDPEDSTSDISRRVGLIHFSSGAISYRAKAIKITLINILSI